MPTRRHLDHQGNVQRLRRWFFSSARNVTLLQSTGMPILLRHPRTLKPEQDNEEKPGAMKIREQTGPAMRTIGSTRIAAELARSVALDGVVGDRWQKLRLIATVVLLLFVPLGVSADRSTTIIVPGSVTASVLEAKIAEIEVAPELPEADKADLLSLYRKALSNLQAAASSSEAAQAFEQAQQTRPRRDTGDPASRWRSRRPWRLRTRWKRLRPHHCLKSRHCCRRRRPISPPWMRGARTSPNGSRRKRVVRH